MKNKGKILMALALGLGFIGNILANKSDELSREEMKKELKSELLSELNGERDA